MLSYRELSAMQHAKLAQQVQLGAPVTAASIVGMVIAVVVAMVIALSMRRHRGVAIRFSNVSLDSHAQRDRQLRHI